MNKVVTQRERGRKRTDHFHLFSHTEILQGLEERLRAQNTSNTTKPLTTRVTTSTVKSNRHTFKDEKVESHTDKNGVCYRIGGKRGINPLHAPV